MMTLLARLSLLALLLAGPAAAAVEVKDGRPSTIHKESYFEMFLAGGWVMWPLAACSLVTIAFAAERLWGLRRARVMPAELKRRHAEVLAALRAGKRERATLAPLAVPDGSEAGKLLASFLNRPFDDCRDMEESLQDYVSIAQYNLQRNVRPLYLMVQIGPLLGLVGTVRGLISAFDVVSTVGLGKPDLLAGSLSQALLPTFLGLVIAISAALLYHYLTERAKLLTLELHGMSNDVIVAWFREEGAKA